MSTPLTVAVVGSGIGGASATYFLKRLLPEADIEVFEASPAVGGRTQWLQVPGGPRVEVGASIAYSGNRYMISWVKEFGIETSDKLNDANFGLWDGRKFLFRGSNFTWRAIRRYSIDLLSLRSALLSTVAKFDKVYELQESGRCFATPSELLEALQLNELVNCRFDDYMKRTLFRGSSSKMLPELLFAVNKVNYNQGNEINALAGLVSMCPMVTGTVLTAKGGWTQIHNRIFQRDAKRLHLDTPVASVSLSSAGAGQALRAPYALHGVDGALLGRFDIVIIAAPFVSRSVDGELAPSPGICINIPSSENILDVSAFSREYQSTHTTFVRGFINGEYSAHEQSRDASTDMITLTEDASRSQSDFFSMTTKQFQFEDGSNLYKVFSTRPLGVSSLSRLFSADSHVVHTRAWRAYPVLTAPAAPLPPFRMIEGHQIYYVGALEGAASAMEILALAGRNVALLAAKDLTESATCPIYLDQ